jgi:hypothetical protein
MKQLYGFFLLIIGLYAQAQAQIDWSTAFSPGRAGLDSMLHFVLEADPETRRELTDCLFPTQSDCRQLFDDPRMGRHVYRYQRYLRRHVRPVLNPRLVEQTEWLIWRATPDELLRYEGEARNFPGGYHELAQYLRPDLAFYRVKFVEPGRKLGSSYDVLVYLDGHWRLVHWLWVILFD